MTLMCTCPECGGDGFETCNNPDHGFINAVGGEIGRLGCPGCIRGNPKNPDHPCYECEGAKRIPIDQALAYLGPEALHDFIWDYDPNNDVDAYAEWSISR